MEEENLFLTQKVKELFDQSKILDDYHPITSLCARFERTCVICFDPQFSHIFFDLTWKDTCIKTLYLLNESDDLLQETIRKIVKLCSGKLFIRVFAKKILSLSDFISIVLPDDRSPPARRVLLLSFRLGRMSKADRSLFFDQVRHNIGDVIVIDETAKLSIEQLSIEAREFQGITERKYVQTNDGLVYALLIRFYHQGEQEQRLFLRKGSSENNLSALSTVRLL